MAQEKLSREDVIKKMQYVLICSLKLDNSNFKYEDLANLLNIAQDDVEEWAIEAIANGIIDAKIDQMNSTIVIKSHKLRELNKEEWIAIKGKLALWKEKFQRMQQVLKASQ